MSNNITNIDPLIKIGYGFVIGGLNTIFWYFITGLFFLHGWENTFQLFISAMLWTSLKIIEFIFLFTASKLKGEIVNKKNIDLSKNRMMWLKVLILAFVVTYVLEFIFHYNKGFWWTDWASNIVQLLLFLNLYYIFKRLNRIDLIKLQNAFEEMESVS